jgi:MoxR-like ATPase
MLNEIIGHKVLMERLLVAISATKSLIIQGPNGVGKTSAVFEAAKVLGRHVEVHIGPSISPESFGINVPSKNFDDYTFLRNSRFMNSPEGTIHLIDEFGHMVPTTQALLGEVVLNRTIQGKALPKGQTFILTANRVGDTAGTSAISRLINTRCPTITYLGPTDQEYVDYLRVNGHPAVATAIEYNPELSHFLKGAYKDIEIKADKLPTHRGWVECSAELSAAEMLLQNNTISSINRLAIIASHVGDKAAAQCEAIIRLWAELPDFSGMDKAQIATMEIPSNPVVRSLIVNQIIGLAKEAVVDRMGGLISRFPAEEQKVMWDNLLAKSSHFASTHAYQIFAREIGRYLNK